MANKKEENKAVEPSAQDKELAVLKAKLEEHQKAIEGFRTSFQNFDTKIKNLIERNRLR